MHSFILWISILFGVSSGLIGGGLFYPGRSDLLELSVIHLNDFHARFEETGPTSGACHENEAKDCVGGFARVYSAVNQLMKENPNSIFLNAGDNFQGTLWYNIHRWNVTATFMNMLPHDAMTIGNHEFDQGIEGIVPYLKMLKSPVVIANIDASEEPKLKGLYKNSTIITRNGRKIGIIGVLVSTAHEISNTEKIKFLDEVESVNEESEKLKSQGVDIIIVLSHSGLDRDRTMAANCPLIDLIVGGHSHTFLYSGTPPFIDEPEDEYPVVVSQEKTGRTVLIVQAAAFTKYLGKLTVWFDKDGKIVDWGGNPILLDHTIEKDPEIVEALKPWKASVDAVALSKVGSAKVYLDSNCRYKQCNLGHFIVDGMVDAYVDMAEDKKHWTYAAVACTNNGGIRAPIDAVDGIIRYGDVIMVHPFENTWDTLELKGSCIVQTLEMRRILVWSGLKVIYKLTNSSRTVVDVKIRCRACEVPKFEDLIDDEWYRIVVPSFLASGGDGYHLFETCRRNYRIGPTDADSLINYIGKMSPITIGIDNRIKFV